MARKRGGLAGLYDKTKPFLRVAAPTLLGAIPGVGVPLAVAAGAALGADKEGRKFFDPRNIGGAIRGGLAGYGGGKMGESIRQTVQNRVKDLLTARAGSKGLEAGTKALEGFQVPDLTDYNALPDVGLRQRGIFEGLTGEGGAPVTSRLTTAAAPKAAAARPVARAAARIAPSSGAVNMPAPQPGMGLQFPGMDEVGRSAYGGAPSFTPQSFRPGLPSSPLGGMPSAQPGPLSFMRGIGSEVPGMDASTLQPPSNLGRAAYDRAMGDLRMPFGDIANANARAGTSNRFVQALLNPQVLGAGVQGLIGQLPSAQSAAMEAQTKLGQGQLALQQAQFEEEKRRADREEQRRRQIAELLMPYMQQQYGSYFGGR